MRVCVVSMLLAMAHGYSNNNNNVARISWLQFEFQIVSRVFKLCVVLVVKAKSGFLRVFPPTHTHTLLPFLLANRRIAKRQLQLQLKQAATAQAITTDTSNSNNNCNNYNNNCNNYNNERCQGRSFVHCQPANRAEHVTVTTVTAV